MQLRARINEDITTQGILLNGNWQKTDYYIMGCDSQSGIAYLTIIEKDVCSIDHHAILYLAERMVIEEEGWNEEIISDLTEENFLNFISGSGYIAGDTGRCIANDEFLKFYEMLTNDIFRRENCPVIKNGVPTSDTDIFFPIEVVSVVCFDDRWNSEQYFVELATRWVYFRWSTNA